ncbi:MAG: PIN domain-containing protein [Daejeonella sp.]|uniref:PIN domain-containing protein n=1 Tax=Daejeonella sp. TaxID=2805397 RepID=UPI002734FAE5|nr:PIN domain-containing protein [Daejeonella sp.]MDP3469962.1 PIN domain-containing protein [Daejeonella sp.]
MNIFLDANILVSVLNKEYPTFSNSARIFSLAGNKKFSLLTSPICLAIAYYFAEKKHKSSVAKSKIKILSEHISIASNSCEAVLKCIENSSIHDFEDGLEYYAALESNCDCIITENKSDFYFSEIEVLNSEEFCKKYLFIQD